MISLEFNAKLSCYIAIISCWLESINFSKTINNFTAKVFSVIRNGKWMNRTRHSMVHRHCFMMIRFLSLLLLLSRPLPSLADADDYNDHGDGAFPPSHIFIIFFIIASMRLNLGWLMCLPSYTMHIHAYTHKHTPYNGISSNLITSIKIGKIKL